MTADSSELTELATLLDNPERRADAAIALGRLGAREYGARIAAALPGLEGREHAPARRRPR
jgi:hypothetical protein